MQRADVPLALLFLRHVRGMTQSEVAAAARMSKGAVSRYENGRTRPRPRTLHRLLEALAVPLSALEETVGLIVRLRQKATLE